MYYIIEMFLNWNKIVLLILGNPVILSLVSLFISYFISKSFYNKTKNGEILFGLYKDKVLLYSERFKKLEKLLEQYPLISPVEDYTENENEIKSFTKEIVELEYDYSSNINETKPIIGEMSVLVGEIQECKHLSDLEKKYLFDLIFENIKGYSRHMIPSYEIVKGSGVFSTDIILNLDDTIFSSKKLGNRHINSLETFINPIIQLIEKVPSHKHILDKKLLEFIEGTEFIKE